MKRSTCVTAVTGIPASMAIPRFAIGLPVRSANNTLSIAFIGSGGWIAQQPYEQGCSEENLVALCDVDRDQCAESMRKGKTTQPFFEDSGVMLDELHKEIDAVVVSTPDHTDVAATLVAMERGIRVYTQTPLTHNIWQATTLVNAKERYKVVKDMICRSNTQL
ncbi:MAG: Gfo/Idh/MocA family oxidoreductase [Verrucomicrobiales bacterium]|nr:Gfo/Idh/MocA family oxidoreductase [Verrucomicrobiales bacterium]